MKKIRISDIENYVEQDVEIKGWLYNKRSSGSIKFLVIRDGTGFIQATLIKGEIENTVFKKTDNLEYESALKVIGLVRKEPRAYSGYEVLIKNIEVISKAEENYDIVHCIDREKIIDAFITLQNIFPFEQGV